MNAPAQRIEVEPNPNELHGLWDLEQSVIAGQMSQLDLIRQTQVLESLGETRAAANLYAMWINHAPYPNKHVALFNCAGLLQQLGQWPQAREAYESSISMSPGFAQSYINLGLLNEKLGLHQEALEAWLRLVGRRFLSPAPANEFLTIAFNHIGRLQETLKNLPQAEEALEQSLRLDPKQPGVIQHWVHIRQKSCKWPIYQALPGITMAELRRYTSPLAMLGLTEDPSEQLAISQSFVARTYKTTAERLCPVKDWGHKTLRVGYVSGDFREHAVGFLLPQYLDAHNRARIELYAYDFTREENTPLRKQLKETFDVFRSVGSMSDREVAQQIVADEIDVLIDLHGLSAGARPGIFELRPAPKQGTYLGFIGPTGMPWLDFVITDIHALPPDLAPCFTEKPVYLDGSLIPLISHLPQDIKISREQIGLPQNSFVMAALGNNYKITPEMFDSWMRLLQRIPKSVLWLIDDNPASTANLKSEALQRGIDPSRLIFTPRVAHIDFCVQLRQADVFLDTYPYNCGSTSNDVVAAGVPLVTRFGKTMVSRMGLSILSALNAQHLACSDLSEYENKVVEIHLKKQAGQLPSYYKSSHGVALGHLFDQILDDHSTSYGVASHVASTDAPPGVRLHHIVYSEATRENIPAQFIALDNLENSRPDWREFWPIRKYLLSHTLDGDVFYGFLSPRFSQKTGLSHEQINQFVRDHGHDHDVLIFSPFWDLNALFLNSFTQGEFFHPGLLENMQQFAREIGLKVQLDEVVSHSNNTAYCNYFIARKSFWLRWLEWGEKLFSMAENEGGEIGQMLAQATHYSEQWLPNKIFVQERLVNLLLATGEFRSKAYNMFSLPSSVTPLNRYLSQAVMADALKMAYSAQSHEVYLSSYHALRQQVWSDSGIEQLAELRQQLLQK